MTQTAQTEISATAIYYVTDKATSEKFFLVKSDSCKNCYHEVRWNTERLAWTCNGEHCQYQRGGTTCKHARACSEVMQARRSASVRLQAAEERAAANLASAERFSPWHGSNPSTEVERPIDERGSLNGSREFRLLR